MHISNRFAETVTAFPPDTPMLTSFAQWADLRRCMQKVPHSKSARNQWTLFIQRFTLVVVPVWYHEEEAWLSSQLFGLPIRRFQLWPQAGCVSRWSWIEIFCHAWKYTTGCLLPVPVRLYLCCLLEIIWEQLRTFFHVLINSKSTTIM